VLAKEGIEHVDDQSEKPRSTKLTTVANENFEENKETPTPWD